jgi:urease subunit gamma/beta
VAPSEVLSGVRELVEDVRLEVLLGDGARLVVLLDPLGGGTPAAVGGPGAIVPAEAIGPGGTQPDRERRSIEVTNTSRRVVRVSSHFPFHAVNPRLEFDRSAAEGFRLDIDAGSSERWSPGETRTITLVRYSGQGG